MPWVRRSVFNPGETGVARKPWPPVLSKYPPTIWPLLLIPKAEVELAPGTSMVVMLPAVSRRKPWSPALSEYRPTIWPLSLTP